MKKLVFAVILVVMVALIGVFLWWQNTQVHDDATIITTAFPEYDAVRAVIGDTGLAVEMLLEPGGEIHHFEPTPQDVIDIKKADFILYGGGESEEWMDELLKNNGIDDDKTLNLLDIIGPDFNGDEEDEHVWTSPINMVEIVAVVRDELSKVWPEKKAEFTANAEKYTTELQGIDQDLREVVKNARTRTLVFADRFPFYYFAKEYGLNYEAAFPGCAEQTEASSKVVAELIDKIKKDDLKVILKIELSDGKLAETIANETDAEVMELNSAHNISRADFENDTTYADIMRENVAVLKEALK